MLEWDLGQGQDRDLRLLLKLLGRESFAFYFVVFSLVHHSLNGLGHGARVGRIGATCLTLGD